MNDWKFAVSLTVVGMGATFITLWLLGFIANLLKKLFPYKESPEK